MQSHILGYEEDEHLLKSRKAYTQQLLQGGAQIPEYEALIKAEWSITTTLLLSGLVSWSAWRRSKTDRQLGMSTLVALLQNFLTADQIGSLDVASAHRVAVRQCPTRHGLHCKHALPQPLLEDASAARGELAQFLAELGRSSARCLANKHLLRSLLGTLATMISRRAPHSAAGTTDGLKQMHLEGPAQHLRIDEDYKEQVLRGRAHDGSPMDVRSFTAIDRQLARDTGRQLAKGDIAAILERQWHEYNSGQPDGVYGIAEDAATIGNPGEDMMSFAFWSARQKHAFWLVPQAHS